MVLWDWDDKAKDEVSLVGCKSGSTGTPKPVVVEEYPTHGRVNKYGFTPEEEAMRA